MTFVWKEQFFLKEVDFDNLQTFMSNLIDYCFSVSIQIYFHIHSNFEKYNLFITL